MRALQQHDDELASVSTEAEEPQRLPWKTVAITVCATLAVGGCSLIAKTSTGGQEIQDERLLEDAKCSPKWNGCMQSGCCEDEGYVCCTKGPYWAGCQKKGIVSQAGKMAIRQRNGLVKFTNYQLKKIVVLTPLTAERADVAKALDTRASPKTITGRIAMPVAPKEFGKQTIQITRLSGVVKFLISPHIQIAPSQMPLGSRRT